MRYNFAYDPGVVSLGLGAGGYGTFSQGGTGVTVAQSVVMHDTNVPPRKGTGYHKTELTAITTGPTAFGFQQATVNTDRPFANEYIQPPVGSATWTVKVWIFVPTSVSNTLTAVNVNVYNYGGTVALPVPTKGSWQRVQGTFTWNPSLANKPYITVSIASGSAFAAGALFYVDEIILEQGDTTALADWSIVDAGAGYTWDSAPRHSQAYLCDTAYEYLYAGIQFNGGSNVAPFWDVTAVRGIGDAIMRITDRETDSRDGNFAWGSHLGAKSIVLEGILYVGLNDNPEKYIDYAKSCFRRLRGVSSPLIFHTEFAPFRYNVVFDSFKYDHETLRRTKACAFQLTLQVPDPKLYEGPQNVVSVTGVIGNVAMVAGTVATQTPTEENVYPDLYIVPNAAGVTTFGFGITGPSDSGWSGSPVLGSDIKITWTAATTEALFVEGDSGVMITNWTGTRVAYNIVTVGAAGWPFISAGIEKATLDVTFMNNVKSATLVWRRAVA
jgi:hypothetical protein